MVHCLATPLLFVSQVGLHNLGQHAGHHSTWWSFLDIIFLVISFMAVYWAAKNTSKKWMKIALLVSFILLTLSIINEQLEVFLFGKYFIYVPAIALIGLHLYNRKYCQCDGNQCCSSKKTSA